MPAERLSIRKVREVFHLKAALGLSYRGISAAIRPLPTPSSTNSCTTLIASVSPAKAYAKPPPNAPHLTPRLGVAWNAQRAPGICRRRVARLDAREPT